MKKDNPEKLATLGTQDTGHNKKDNVREYRRGNEKLATLGTQDTGQKNVREYQGVMKHDNPEKLAT